jgi:hypothetical protein
LRLPAATTPHPVLVNIHGGFWRNKYDLTHAGPVLRAARMLRRGGRAALPGRVKASETKGALAPEHRRPDGTPQANSANKPSCNALPL